MRTLQKTLQKFGGKGQIFPNTLTNLMKNIQIFKYSQMIVNH